MNTGLSSWLHPWTFNAWSAGASAIRRMKAHDTKRAFKLPCHKAESKNFRTATNLVSKRAKFNVDFENNRPFRKTSVRDEKLHFPLIVRKSLEFFCKQTRIGISPTRKADPNIFLIALKQDYIDAQYVKLPYSVTFFHFRCCTAQTKAKCSKT